MAPTPKVVSRSCAALLGALPPAPAPFSTSLTSVTTHYHRAREAARSTGSGAELVGLDSLQLRI